MRTLIDQGHDPAGQKRERREAPTVQDLIDRYIADHLKKKSAEPARVADEKRMLAEIGRRLGKHTKVVDVHGGDIGEMHRKISESIGRGDKPRLVRANRILAVASKMFSLALVPRAGETLPWRNAVLGNPCKGIERNPEEGRERFFSRSELGAISDALAEYQGVAADCVRLIMLTGCRPAEAMKATWEEFNNEPGYWIKPSAHTKQRKPHRLPLNPPAIELIDRLRKKRKGNNWVFPGDKPGEHLAALWHIWHFVRKKTGLGKDARLYDLRHTFASVGAGGGLGLPIIGRLLGPHPVADDSAIRALCRRPAPRGRREDRQRHHRSGEAGRRSRLHAEGGDEMTGKPIADAVEEVAKRLGITITEAKVKLLDALHAGRVGARWRLHVSGESPMIAKGRWAGADIDVKHDRVVLANGDGMQSVEIDHDYQAWLHAQARPDTLPPAKTDTTLNPRPQNQRDRASQAIAARWPNGLPAQSELPNGVLCAEVIEWIKADCETRGLPLLTPSDDTIERAAREARAARLNR